MLLSKIFLFFWTVVLAGSAVAAPVRSNRSRPRPFTSNKPSTNKPSTSNPFANLPFTSTPFTSKPLINKPIINKPIINKPVNSGPRPQPVVAVAPVTTFANTSVASIVARDELATLGYRTVSKAQADLYNNNGKLSDGFNIVKSTGAKQIGYGVYTTPGPGEWLGERGDWFCLIQGKKQELDKYPKVWIPEEHHWKPDTSPMYKWGQKKFPKIKFGSAFRLSEITRVKVGKHTAHDRTMQLLIPSEVMVNPKLEERLGLTVQCKRDWRQLPVKEMVNYDTAWPKTSIYGKSEWVNPPPPSKGCWGFKSCFGGSA